MDPHTSLFFFREYLEKDMKERPRKYLLEEKFVKKFLVTLEKNIDEIKDK